MPMPKKRNNVRIIFQLKIILFSENDKKNMVNVHVELNLFDFDDFLIYGACIRKKLSIQCSLQ